jgi:diaminohydroxyphosphoribosylaminopyrimidine deaminase/5-amino-6-(5-phosphoribosylamino)uracil reductase
MFTGIGTALSDNPTLTCRLPGMAGQSPVRVVLDRELRLPDTSALATTAKKVPVWVFCSEEAAADRERALGETGVVVVRTKTGEGGLDLHAVLQALGTRGITRLMVEAGPKLSASFLRADLVDEAVLVRGPSAIGADGIDALDGLPLSALTGSPKLKQTGTERVGADVHLHLERR